MDEKFKAALEAGAKVAEMSLEEFIERIFRYRKREYELGDIKDWLQDNDISDIRPEEILEEFYHHGDCNDNYWCNLKSAYKRVRYRDRY